MNHPKLSHQSGFGNGGWSEALYLARNFLTPLKDTPFYDDLNQAFKRIEEKIGTKSQDYFRALSSEKQVDVQTELSSLIASNTKDCEWHPSQRVVKTSDDSIVMYLQITLTPNLTPWVLGSDVNARFIEPEFLKGNIVQAAEKLVQYYENNRVA